jgi:predicted NUDIX family NTP pyrophosphohydrolase
VALSAGILLWRRRDAGLEVLLVHPGGPFFRKKDEGSWSVPKGLVEQGEDEETTARRELVEELGLAIELGELVDLGEIVQKGHKRVRGFAGEADCDADAIRSNTFELEWPPRSGQRQAFPEIDRAAWFDLAEAARKVNPAQVAFLERLVERVG